MFALGPILEAQRQRILFWRRLFFASLALFTIVNLFLTPDHPHFGVDAYPCFWAAFGLGVGLVMVFVMKRVIQPLIMRKEDYYGDL